LGVLALGISLPMTAVVVGTGAVFDIHYQTTSIASIFLYVFVISLAVSTIGVLVDRAWGNTQNPNPATARTPAFLRRIPARLAGGELYALEAEDHYLRVHTSRGDDLVLMRFSDALLELAGLDGLRVHRSWWVARIGVQKIQREGSRMIIHLRDGHVVPVSRTNYGALRAAKWK
jgi:DNA-binding LytR/AlgR family response regulator